MKFNSDFSHDLELAQETESEVARILLEKGNKVEVKDESRLYKHTGNVFIELWSRGKESGLSTTKAEWYLFVLNENTIILKTVEQLKEIVRVLHESGRPFVCGGDSNTSKGMLLKVAEDLI